MGNGVEHDNPADVFQLAKEAFFLLIEFKGVPKLCGCGRIAPAVPGDAIAQDCTSFTQLSTERVGNDERSTIRHVKGATNVRR